MRAGAGVLAAGAAATLLPRQAGATAGATDNFDPYPIPWLDKNLHHNQVPMPGGGGGPTELSHIFHFTGGVGRTLMEGQGQSGDGQTLYIGQGTDYGYTRGSYLPANGDANFGAFTHI